MTELLQDFGAIEEATPGVREYPPTVAHVFISLSRFEELVRTETELDTICRAYHSRFGFNLSFVLQSIFGPVEAEKPEKPENEEGNNA